MAIEWKSASEPPPLTIFAKYASWSDDVIVFLKDGSFEIQHWVSPAHEGAYWSSSDDVVYWGHINSPVPL